MKASIKRDNGFLKVDIDGKLYAPLSFKSFRPNPTNVSEFYKAGVRLFSVLSSGIICALGVPYSRFGESWVGDGEYDFSAVDKQMDMFIENAPVAYFEDGSVGVARRGNIYYSAACFIHSDILRKIARDAGAFIYSEYNKVYTYVNRGAIGVYNATENDAVIRVPENGIYTDRITGERFVAKGSSITLPERTLRAYLLVK